MEKKVWEQFATIEADSYRFASEKGMKVEDLPPDEVVAWRACSSSILETYMTKAGEIGEQLMRAYARLRMAPCCNKAANAGVDP